MAKTYSEIHRARELQTIKQIVNDESKLFIAQYRQQKAKDRKEKQQEINLLK